MRSKLNTNVFINRCLFKITNITAIIYITLISGEKLYISRSFLTQVPKQYIKLLRDQTITTNLYLPDFFKS